MKYINGYKVYIGCVVAMGVLTAHLLGYSIPYVKMDIDDAQYANNMWALVMVMFGRNAMPDKKGII